MGAAAIAAAFIAAFFALPPGSVGQSAVYDACDDMGHDAGDDARPRPRRPDAAR